MLLKLSPAVQSSCSVQLFAVSLQRLSRTVTPGRFLQTDPDNKGFIKQKHKSVECFLSFEQFC